MINCRKTIIFFALIHFNSGYIEDTFTIDHIPGGILKEITDIITGGIVKNVLGCLYTDYNEDNVKLWLFNRKHPIKPIPLGKKKPFQLSESKPTKVIIHGWLGNASDDRIIELKDAYLETYDCNVIGVEWTTYATVLYSHSYCHVPKVAKTLSRYLCEAVKVSNGSLDSVHIIGHSLGAQMAGLIGQMVKNLCKARLGRITGLDPAGPLFTYLPKDRRLDSSDASFVDVIHTNGLVLGYYDSCGTVDFFVNCGTAQSGCFFKGVNSLKDIINLPIHNILCNHFRSIDYMTESVYSKGFIGKSCTNCPYSCEVDTNSLSYNIMGEHIYQKEKNRQYYIETNSKRPFCIEEHN